ncbi:hypothetical protein C8J55DRAFT_554430 [Lentinula edodes]|uniref:F-box domain-containing protein n=1 Tax=Lentinula lateritia TaxID=40482 RepID=A0A9W9B1R0_9AGAR|nr:hypothetical protein C8J55DRAFT_554430 [Lentinula edodes]
MSSTIVFPHLIPTRFCPELFGEYLSYVHGVDLDACSQVCHYWREPALFARFRTVDVEDENQLALLAIDSRRLRYVRNVIGDSRSAFTTAFSSYPVHLRTLEIRKKDFVVTNNQINQAIAAFSSTLTTFTINSSLRMSYKDFCEMLQCLVQCKSLRNLTFPPPARAIDDRSSSQERAEEAHTAINAMTLVEEEKAKLTFLQLIPTSYRQDPQYTGSAPYAQEYEWLKACMCPFDLCELETLVIGSASATQILLPSVSKHLTRLEFCLPFDNRSAWTGYETLRATPIVLPRLRHLGLTFHIRPSNWLLDIIRTPVIETICLKWKTSISYCTYEKQFGNIDKQIARLDDGRVFPEHLSKVYLVTISDPGAQWCAQAFPICFIFGVKISSYCD